MDTTLTWCGTFLKSEWFPVKMARFEGRSPLEHWFEEVLKPINQFWDSIQCADCRRHDVELLLKRMNAKGVIVGSFSCRYCRHEPVDVTVLTRCRGCEAYPLIIGRNATCNKCRGLVCSEPQDNGADCGACKC